MLQLNNEAFIPAIVMGTFPLRGMELQKLIPSAIELGYRAFDTAWLYKNEVDLGIGIRKSNIPREQLFLSSKLNIGDLYMGRFHHKLRSILPQYKSVRKSYFQSCQRLEVGYLDLYLLHYPYPYFKKYWKEMVALYDEGLIKAIGVSSFKPEHLQALHEVSAIVPAINQIEMNPFNTNKKTLDYCNEHNIRVEAFSPFGRGLLSAQLFSNPTLLAIAKNHNKSVAQVILRWLRQLGVIAIPRSNKIYKLKENLDTADFELSIDEMTEIDSLNQNTTTINGQIKIV